MGDTCSHRIGLECPRLCSYKRTDWEAEGEEERGTALSSYVTAPGLLEQEQVNCSTLGLEVAQIARIVERLGEESKGWDKFSTAVRSLLGNALCGLVGQQ